jgi:hypothetical protein
MKKLLLAVLLVGVMCGAAIGDDIEFLFEASYTDTGLEADISAIEPGRQVQFTYGLGETPVTQPVKYSLDLVTYIGSDIRHIDGSSGTWVDLDRERSLFHTFVKGEHGEIKFTVSDANNNRGEDKRTLQATGAPDTPTPPVNPPNEGGSGGGGCNVSFTVFAAVALCGGAVWRGAKRR